MAYLVLAINILISSTAQIFLKKGMLKLGNLDISLRNIFYLIFTIFKNWWLLAGVIFYGIGFLLYVFTLFYLQLNIAYPVAVSAGIVLISLASRFLFKESTTPYQILGIVVIVSGIFLLVTK